MKKYLFSSSVILLLFCGNLFAQDSPTLKTLFGENGIVKTIELGFFLAPSYGPTRMDGSNATILNLRGGFSVNQKFAAGAYFNITHNESRPSSEQVPNLHMEYLSAGAFTEYTLFSQKLIHLTFPIYLGYGKVEMFNQNGSREFGKENFFQIEPSVLLEINLTNSTKLNIGAGHRFVSQMEYRNLDQSNISGFNAYVGLKFSFFE